MYNKNMNKNKSLKVKENNISIKKLKFYLFFLSPPNNKIHENT